MKTELPSNYPKGTYLNVLPISENEVIVTVVGEEGEVLWRGSSDDFAEMVRNAARQLGNKVN